MVQHHKTTSTISGLVVGSERNCTLRSAVGKKAHPTKHPFLTRNDNIIWRIGQVSQQQLGEKLLT